MLTQNQIFNVKPLFTGAAFKKFIVERLPQNILEQMHIIDLTRKTDNEIISNIANA